MEKKEKIQLICLKCNHQWIQRGKNKPKKCPCCNNPNWNKRNARNIAKLILG